MTNNFFVFSRHDDIGAAAAEDDEQFLEECFLNTGEIELLKDCTNAKRIIVGRTGAGKSALMLELGRRCENVIPLSPHSLSLNFLANNKLLSFFEDAGVNLDPFYGLLWKHIIVVEFLKKKFNITNDDAQKNYMRHIRNIVYKKDKIKEIAVDYFEKWGNKFWLTTEERIKEITDKIEGSLTAALSGHLAGVKGGINGSHTLTTEEKREITERGQKAVSEVQVRELENMINILADDIFTDAQEHYYITIDMLDEEWADERIRYKLIKALLDTIRRFRRVKNTKIIIALRQDLLDKVLHSTREIGFQEEKYESLYMELRWSRRNLYELIERRINALVKRRYTKALVNFAEIFPASINGALPLDYILDRTFLRPRDAILFMNECIALAEDSKSITSKIIKAAEEQYSYKRLQSLATEWLSVYPHLSKVLTLFNGTKENFPVSDLTEKILTESYAEIAQEIRDPTRDPITLLLNRLYTDPNANFNSVRNSFLREVFITGLIGIKTSASSTTQWATDTRITLPPGQVKPSSVIYIHPMFHRALDTISQKRYR